MTVLGRIRLSLTGFPGGPGVWTFYCLEPIGMRGFLHTWKTAIMTQMPSNVTCTVANSGDYFEDTTGTLTGAWSDSPVYTTAGSQAGAYPAAAGALARWTTTTILDGHRVKGSTFIVPISGSQFQTDGTLSSTTVAAIVAANAALVTAATGNFAIWHRPREAKAADGSRPAVTARDGGHALVTGSGCPDKCVILRSRRD